MRTRIPPRLEQSILTNKADGLDADEVRAIAARASRSKQPRAILEDVLVRHGESFQVAGAQAFAEAARAAGAPELGVLGDAVAHVKGSEAALRTAIAKVETQTKTLEEQNRARSAEIVALTQALRGEINQTDDASFFKALIGTVATLSTGGLLPLAVGAFTAYRDRQRMAELEGRLTAARADKARIDGELERYGRLNQMLGSKLETLRESEQGMLARLGQPAHAPAKVLKLAATVDRIAVRERLVDNLESQLRVLEEVRDAAAALGVDLGETVERLRKDVADAHETAKKAWAEVRQVAKIALAADPDGAASSWLMRLAQSELTAWVKADLFGPPPPPSARAETTAWVAKNARELNVLGPLAPPGGGGQRGFEALDALVGPARVVALGEAAHGQHEFAALRNRMFAHLIEKHGFRALTLESGIVESRIVDRYVRGEPGVTLEQALRDGFTHGMGPYDETRELVEWVRAYNQRASVTGSAPVRFVGKDLPRTGDTVTAPLAQTFAYLRAAGGAGPARLMQLAEKSASVLNVVLATLQANGKPAVIDPDHLDVVTSLGWSQLTPSDRLELARGLSELRGSLVEHGNQWVAAYGARTGASAESAKDEHAWAVHMVRVAEQLVEDLERREIYPADPMTAGAETFLKKVYAAAGTPMPAIPEAKRAAADDPVKLAEFFAGRASRERHLAENVVAMTERYGKLLSFAHNGHVSRAGNGTVAGGQPVADTSEGETLARTLGPEYLCIGATTGRYTGRAEAPGELEAVLAGAGPRLVDLRAAPSEGAVHAWLNAPQPQRYQWDLQPVVPAKSYDAVVYLPETGPALHL